MSNGNGGNGGFSDGSSGYGADASYGFNSSGFSSDAAMADGLGYGDPFAAFSGDPSVSGPPVDQFSSYGDAGAVSAGPVDLGNPSTSSDSGGGIGSSILSGLESAGSFFGGLGSDLMSGLGSIGSTLTGIGSDLLGGTAGAISGLVSGLGGSKALGQIAGGLLRSTFTHSAQRGALTSLYGGYNGRPPTAFPSSRMISQRNIASALMAQPRRRNRSLGAYGQPAPIPIRTCA